MKHIKGTPWTLEKIKFFLKKEKSPYSTLFSEYLGQNHKHEWKCKKCKTSFFVSWKVMWKTVRGIREGGCMKCANRLNYTIEQVHQELKDSNRPIVCLSKTYENNKKPMQWQCLNEDCGHKWTTGWKNIKGVGKSKGQGCIVCANNVKYTIEKINEIVEKKKIPLKLLSTEYVGNTEPLEWKCNKCTQKWETSWASINCNDRGCPFCATCGQTEEKISIFLNEVFGLGTFKKVRPDFLKNPKTGKNLELDMYSEKLNLAIEINGQLHYKYSPYFHKTKSKFNETKRKDKFKKKRLKEKGVNFICIPIHNMSFKKIKKFLREELEKLGYEIPSKFNDLNIV